MLTFGDHLLFLIFDAIAFLSGLAWWLHPFCYANNTYPNTVDPNAFKSQHFLKVQEYLLALGLRIRELRLKKLWSQEGFADIVGVHRT
jgi:hypothetical protein